MRNWLALTFALSLGFSSSQAAGGDLPVFIDQALNGFEIWGWAQHSVTNTAPVHTGSRSISVSSTGWTGLYIHHTDLNTSGFTNLSLWVHGGEIGGQLLQISGKLGTNDLPAYSLPPLPAQKWQQFVIPLELLGVDNKTNFTGFLVMLRGEGPTNTFYLDDICFGSKALAPEPRVIVNESQSIAPVTIPPAAEQHQPTPPVGGGKDGTAFTMWIAAALGAIVLLLVCLILVARRGALGARDSGLVSSVALMSRSSVSPAALEPESSEDWRQRALAAEAVASKQAQILRDKLVPEMAEFAKSSLVQGLASQRNVLLETQRRAQQELTELEARLANLHLPLRDRIGVYERRISELEKELVTRGEEMRELIRATLALVRQRLAEEKKKEFAGSGSN